MRWNRRHGRHADGPRLPESGLPLEIRYLDLRCKDEQEQHELVEHS